MSVAFVGNPLVELMEQLPASGSHYAMIHHTGVRKFVIVAKVSNAQLAHYQRTPLSIHPEYQSHTDELMIHFRHEHEPPPTVRLPLHDVDCQNQLIQTAISECGLTFYLVSEHMEHICNHAIFHSPDECQLLRHELAKAHLFQNE